MLKLPLLSVSYWLNLSDRPLSLRASFLLILLSLFLSRSVKLMLLLPLVDAPALPLTSPELEPLLDAPLLVSPDEDAPPLVAELSPVLPVVPLLVEAPPEPDAPPLEAPPVVSVVAPVLLLPLLPMLSAAKAPNDASDMDIANVKMNFLFIKLSLKGICEKGTCNIATRRRPRVVRKSESASTTVQGAVSCTREHDCSLVALQCLYDLRLVCASQRAAQRALARCRTHQLGYRLIRVSAAGAGESSGVWQLQPGATQGHARDHRLERVRAVRRVVHEGTPALGFSLGGAVSGRGGVLHVSRCQAVSPASPI